VDTDNVYYCSKCNFVAHLDCATREGYTEEIKKEDSKVLDESINDSLAYAVKKITMGEDKIEIAQEIKHFSHQHDLMGVCILYSLHFTLVLNGYFFFINLVLNYPEKSNTHFTPTSLPSSQRRLIFVAASVVMFVVVNVLASPTIVIYAILMQMSNVV